MRFVAVPAVLLLAMTAVGLPTTQCAGAEAQPDAAALLAAARTADAAYRNHLARLQDDITAAEPTTRVAAIGALARLADPEAVRILAQATANPRTAADDLARIATALGNSGLAIAVDPLHKLMTQPDPQVRFAAYNALMDLGAATVTQHTAVAKADYAPPHLAALTNLGTLKQADAAPLLVAGLARNPKAIVRRQCAIGLGRLGDPAHATALQDALSDPDAGVRRYAGEALAALNHRPAIPFILMALEANIAGDELNQVLKRMTGEDFGFRTGSDGLKRREAIDRGFAWWTAHATDG